MAGGGGGLGGCGAPRMQAGSCTWTCPPPVTSRTKLRGWKWACDALHWWKHAKRRKELAIHTNIIILSQVLVSGGSSRVILLLLACTCSVSMYKYTMLKTSRLVNVINFIRDRVGVFYQGATRIGLIFSRWIRCLQVRDGPWLRDQFQAGRGVHCMRTWSWQGCFPSITWPQTAIGRFSSTTSSHFYKFFSFLATATWPFCLASMEPCICSLHYN